MSEFIKSRLVRTILIALGSLVILSGVFALGARMGQRQERHFTRWSEGYDRMFGRPGPGGLPPGRPMFPMEHAIFGKVISMSTSTMVVQGKEGIEQSVTMASSTEIRAGRETIAIKDIKPDAEVAIFGAPNEQGQIEARLIRVMPAQPQPQK